MNEETLSAKESRYKFLTKLNVKEDVERRLSLLLSATYLGNRVDHLTPIGREYTPEHFLREWDKVFLANESVLIQELVELEREQRNKYGPMSISKSWNNRKSTLIESYHQEEIDSSVLSLIPNIATSLSKLRPVSAKNAISLLQNTTSSGLPFYAKKGSVKEEVLENFEAILKRKDPCILFTRTQEQGKTRNVWGFPIADTLNEMRYYSPLLAHQKKLNYRSAIVGPTDVDSKISNIFSRARDSGRHLLSIDFTAYDSTVKSSLQKVGFNYIRSLFQGNCKSDLDYIEERFGTIGIVTPEGLMTGSHGVPSGSTFTNEVDSIVQASIALSHDFVSELDMQVQGDDGVYAIPFDKYSEFVKRFNQLGTTITDEKSHFETNWCIYLQKLYHSDYSKDGFIGGVYPIYRALNRIIHQERWSNFEEYGILGRDYYSIRTICILENCKYHPLFRKFVEFIFRMDKYSLHPTDDGIAKYVQMIGKTKRAGGILLHQYGDDVDGIKNFETFKVLKELS